MQMNQSMMQASRISMELNISKIQIFEEQVDDQDVL